MVEGVGLVVSFAFDDLPQHRRHGVEHLTVVPGVLDRNDAGTGTEDGCEFSADGGCCLAAESCRPQRITVIDRDASHNLGRVWCRNAAGWVGTNRNELFEVELVR